MIKDIQFYAMLWMVAIMCGWIYTHHTRLLKLENEANNEKKNS
jgi:hypothetical protein